MRKKYNQPYHKKWVDPDTKSYDDHLQSAYDRGQIDKATFRDNFKKQRENIKTASVHTYSRRNRASQDLS